MRFEIGSLVVDRSDEGWPYWFRIHDKDNHNAGQLLIHHKQIPYLADTLKHMYAEIKQKVEELA